MFGKYYIMNRLSAIIIFFIFCSIITHSSLAELSSTYKQAVYDIFPSLRNFAEEKNNWLDSSIIEESHDKYSMLKKTYTYYSKRSQVIFDIKREPTFSVDVAIYITKDYGTADNIFNELQKQIKYKYKKEMSFGQESYFYINPVDIKNLKANFYTFTKNQNFIIKIASNDGFAIMDFTEYISNNLANFIYQNIDIYTFNRLRVKCTINDRTSQTSDILLLNKKYKGITIEGTIKNTNLDVIKGATVELIELGIKAISDENGNYILNGNLGKSGDNIKLTKNFIFGEKIRDTSPYNFELYEINISYKDKEKQSNDQFYLKINKNIASYGDIYSIKNKHLESAKILVNNNTTLEFIRDCSTALFSCKQKFYGVNKGKNITGKWEGFGGGGNFVGKKISHTFEEKINLKNTEICNIGVLIEKQDGAIHTSYVGSLYSYIYPEEKSYIYINCNPINKNLFFLKDAYLELYHLPQQQYNHVKLGIYYGNTEVNKLELYDNFKEFDLENFNEPTKIKLNITDYLIDRLNVNKSLLIGIVGNYPINLIFAGTNSPLDVTPKIILNNFDTHSNSILESSINADLCIDQSQDYASNSSRPSPDGKEDLCLSFDLKNITGQLRNMVVTYKSTFDFIWNLKDDDIYPGIVFVKNGKPIDMKSYRIQENDNFYIYLAKPDFFENSGSLNYSIQIDSKNYKGNIPLNH